MKIGTVTGPLLNNVASELESLGYDTVLFTDNQGAAPDVWTALGFAVSQTTRVTIGPGVTNAVLNDDADLAREAVRGTAALWARFSAFRGRDLSSLPGPLARAAEYLRANYEMSAHGEGAAEHARGLPDEFLDWFTITGSADRVHGRLEALAATGLDYCYVVPGALGFADAVGAESISRIAREVIPRLDT